MNQLQCSGAIILAKTTKRFLLVQRTQLKTVGTWGLVGGKRDPSDTSPLDTLTREISEELGKSLKISKIVPLDLYTSDDNYFLYNTYVIIVDKEFVPILNEEHSGYAWCSFNCWPKPLHHGVKQTLTNKIIKSKLQLILDLI
jgi:8-oxo-dGTP pyrophosphatase MutT (NUDIX family)